MKVTKKPLSDLRRPERNVRMHTDKQLKEFRRSVEMFGQIRPIVVDEAGEALREYGTIDQDKVEEIRETGERYEAREEASAKKAEQYIPQESPGGAPAQAEQTQRFVLCPKCGERIWL